MEAGTGVGLVLSGDYEAMKTEAEMATGKQFAEDLYPYVRTILALVIYFRNRDATVDGCFVVADQFMRRLGDRPRA